jgi:hypothetical protein
MKPRGSRLSADSSEFRVKAAYLGGHPRAVKSCKGRLSLEAGVLRWSPMTRKWRVELPSFEIDVAIIASVDFKGDADLKKAPSGYLRLLPGLATSFGGSLARHPLGTGRLTKLLIVHVAPEFGAWEVVFANTPDTVTGPLGQKAPDKGGYELMTRILAARDAARSGEGSQVPANAVDRGDIAGALERLNDLRERGLIEADEYATKRTEILSRL